MVSATSPLAQQVRRKEEEEKELVCTESLVRVTHCAKGYVCAEMILFDKLFIVTAMRQVLSPSPFYR